MTLRRDNFILCTNLSWEMRYMFAAARSWAPDVTASFVLARSKKIVIAGKRRRNHYSPPFALRSLKYSMGRDGRTLERAARKLW